MQNEKREKRKGLTTALETPHTHLKAEGTSEQNVWAAMIERSKEAEDVEAGRGECVPRTARGKLSWVGASDWDRLNSAGFGNREINVFSTESTLTWAGVWGEQRASRSAQKSGFSELCPLFSTVISTLLSLYDLHVWNPSWYDYVCSGYLLDIDNA